jgi:predicted permease
MDTIFQLFGIVAPVFVCVGLGVLWAKIGAAFDSKLITSLVYNIGAPCLILATFQKVDLSPAAMGEVALATISCYAAFTILSILLIRLLRLEIPSYLPSLIFPLTASMGLPVCYFALGDEGLALAIVYFTFGAIGTFTAGAAIAAGTLSFRRLMRAPVVHAVLLAVVLQLTDTSLPKWLFNSVNLLGGMVIPAQLVALGVSLLELRVGGLVRSSLLGVFRLVMGVGVGFAVAAAFDLEGAARAVVILQSAMPVAVSSYLFAQQYNRKPDEVAGMIVVSTGISFITLPFLLLAVL